MNTFKRILALTLAVVMTVSLCGFSVLAEAPESQNDSEETPVVSPEPSTEISPEVSPEASPEALPEVSPEVSPEASPEVTEEPEEDAVVFEQQKIQALAAGTYIYINGELPVGAYATATPVTVEIDGLEVIAAYDITIFFANGDKYQPEDHGKTVSVSIDYPDLANYETVDVYHMVNKDAEPEFV